jgi:formamidopyrimidine-DNA glycosylase
MPELPEVETCVRELEPQLMGRRVHRAQVFWPRIIAEPDALDFTRLIVGRRFTTFGRRGKYMLLGLTGRDSTPGENGARVGSGEDASDSTLIVHLRMTGSLSLAPMSQAPDKHTHMVLDLDEDQTGLARLVFVDSRKFGRIWLTRSPEQVLAKLGPEPLSPAFTPAGLGKKLQGRKASIKALLLDQSIVAGVGNIYADEALFRARIHPAQPSGSLDAGALERLHTGICQVLQEAIDRQGSSLGGSALQNYTRPGGESGGFQDEFRVFRRTGQACLRCQTPIERTVIAQRGTHFCPACQRLNSKP